MNETDWEPDLILTREHPLGGYATIYLDGEKLDKCVEVRVRWASFVEPTFGEAVINAVRDGKSAPVIMYKPHLGEFDYNGAWVRFVCGKLRVELDETGQRLFTMLAANTARVDNEV